MAQKKEATASTDKKPKAKVQDLAPRKDAKGGGGGPRSTGDTGLKSTGGTGLKSTGGTGLN